MPNGPDFIIPGASKSGTTSLYHYLNEHESIILPETKELHFFDRNINYEQGIDYYESKLPSTGDGHVVGDITPSYFYANIIYDSSSYDTYRWSPSNDVPSRIHGHYPDLKIILTLRNPITRAHSQFWKNYRQGRERANSFADAIRSEINGKREPESHPFCWLYRNDYTEHVGRWLDLFDQSQIHVIIFEKWIENTKLELNNICDFLGIEPRRSWSRSDERKNIGGQPRVVALNRIYQDYIQGTPLGRVLQKTRVTHLLDALNSNRGYPEVSDEARNLLSTEFEPMFEELEKLLNRDLDIWREELA